MRRRTRELLKGYIPTTMPQAIRDVAEDKAKRIESIAETDLSPALARRCRTLAAAIRKDGGEKADKTQKLIEQNPI